MRLRTFEKAEADYVSDYLARQTVRYSIVKTSVMTDSTYSFTSSAHVTHHYNDSHAPGDCISSAISLQVHSGNFNFSELERFWQRDTPRNGHIKTHPEKCRAFLLNLGSRERNGSKRMRLKTNILREISIRRGKMGWCGTWRNKKKGSKWKKALFICCVRDVWFHKLMRSN